MPWATCLFGMSLYGYGLTFYIAHGVGFADTLVGISFVASSFAAWLGGYLLESAIRDIREEG